MLLIGAAVPNDTCEDVIAYLEAHPEVDIFISEINLPAMNGWELIEKNQGTFSASARNSLFLRPPGRETGRKDGRQTGLSS